jgi:hypothetical protein
MNLKLRTGVLLCETLKIRLKIQVMAHAERVILLGKLLLPLH